MRKRFWLSSSALAIVMATVLWAPTLISAQGESGVAAKSAGKTAAPNAKTPASKNDWTVPKTPDGQPDLQGYWTSVSFTPLERPKKYGTREFLTDAEAQQFFDDAVKHNDEVNSGDPTDYSFKQYGLSPWQNGARPNHRTSLIVDPPDGRIPSLTPAEEASVKRGKNINNHAYFEGEGGEGVVHADVPSDLGIHTTCISMNAGPPIVPNGYNSGLMIVQNPGQVVIETEYGTEVRIIPLDGRPHVGANIQQWHGDGRGHWEGNTLVVETTNFRPEDAYRNANPKTLKITEYFTRTAADTIEYKFTVDDPSTWVKPWTAIVPLAAIKGPLFEYDCSEDDFDVVNIMAGARADEKAAKPAAH